MNPRVHLEECTIKQIQTWFQTGELSARELVQYYFERIARYDKAGPKINSVIEINPDAMDIAEALDEEFKRSGLRGPMHGIPIIIKDNIDTKDRMHTSAGSLALQNSYAPEDAFLVKQLRSAGAVIIGKANMTEWANFMAHAMTNGFSSRGGQVLNPYGYGFDVGGSSSGSGAAVACNFATVTIGTETSGSILNPASRNSVVGIKPTVGLISRSGIIPIAHSQDTAGPMARTVEDAAILLAILTGMDQEDPATWKSEGKAYKDYTPYLDVQGLKGARIGIPRFYYENLTDEEKQIMNRAIHVLREQGAEIVDEVVIHSADKIAHFSSSPVLTYEFKSDLNYYLSKLSPLADVHSLKEVIEYNNNHAEACLKFGQGRMLPAEETSGTLTEPEYLLARLQDIQLSQTEGIDQAMKEYQLDSLLFPANLGAGIAAKAGYPSITVPGGYKSNGEPLGVTFTGMAFTEPVLIKQAYAFEQASQYRVPPKLS